MCNRRAKVGRKIPDCLEKNVRKPQGATFLVTRHKSAGQKRADNNAQINALRQKRADNYA